MPDETQTSTVVNADPAAVQLPGDIELAHLPYDRSDFGPCEFEAPVRERLRGEIAMWVYDHGNNPSTVIDIKKGGFVIVRWRVHGRLARLLCGTWCVCLHLESIGTCKEVSVCRDYSGRRECEHDYIAVIPFPVGQLDVTDCSCPYKLAVTVQLHDPCGEPGPFAGFCEGEMIQLYNPGS